MYSHLASHPDVVAPVYKEARYLTLPKYRFYTGSWYASNFFPVAARENAVTFDASPTVFNAPLLAPGWIRKWVPTAKHLVLLRDPVQRTYSHWRTGVRWLRASACFVTPPVPGNASKAHAEQFFAAVPIPEIRMMREVFAFDAQARLGVLEVVLRDCGASSGWGRYGGDEVELSNETKACILTKHVGEEIAALWKTRQALAARRSAEERDAYAEGMRRVSSCSEFMLRPGAGVWRSSRYASNLGAWYGVFPRDQIKVVATEELELDRAAVMRDVTRFLGLRQVELGLDWPPPAHQRTCVVGKAGVLDETATVTSAWRAGRLESSSDEGGDGGAALGECPPEKDKDAEKVRGKDGISRYVIDDETEALLRRFFMPYNAKLFALLGRKLPWSE